ncbi:DgyrCDS10193 [Dimorphilus gyrociliatus]|uniref:choline-phosphate cytidylyltransferase n=1 Tax=Dimorphilus gyrociliatus TaxID=2664684 RepID=A0A7I8VZE9_9ANNE|nr:DgyrCDS10193 [Dimorphilus gyrociliatus]
MSSRKRSRREEKEDNNVTPAKRMVNYKPAPYSSDEAAKLERANCDYTIKITKEMADGGTAPRQIRVYADGIYDMFHSGHARQLMQAKMCFPNVYLLVGICNDELTHRMKGRTVMNEEERYEAVRHCRYVDEIVTDAPWQLTDEYLRNNKIDFVAHDDIPYAASGAEDIYKSLKEKGMFVATNRTEGISTTDVIARIIKDYDMYVRRNLARGYTAKELNVSYVREKRIQFQEKMSQVKGKSEKIIKTIDDKKTELISKWEDMSHSLIGNFLDVFGKDGRINQWLNDKRLKVARAISPADLEEDKD